MFKSLLPSFGACSNERGVDQPPMRNENLLPRCDKGLAEGIVHVWRGSLDVSPERLHGLAALLSPDELERASRYRFPLHRDHFIAGRGYLRELLAGHIGQPPETIQFKLSRYGKPEVEGIHFNITHSDHHLLIAVAQDPVGIDLEIKRAIPELEGLASNVLSERELAFWPQAPRIDSFLALWTRKEALLKGVGLGITEHLKNVSVYFETTARIEVTKSLTRQIWNVRTFQEPAAVWSVALPLANFKVSQFELRHEPHHP
jgi:4'-phosphopantetheinyl transferase